MATGAEGIILQPLWKIHNIDWSVRRNVFETDPSCPSLDLLRRNKIILSRYVNDLTRYDFFRFDNIDSQGDRGKWTINSSGSSVYRHPASKWSRFALDTINSAGIASY